MDLSDFQSQAWMFARYSQKGEGTWMSVAYAALGAAGEAGEIANKVKKINRDDGMIVTPERREQLLKEAGDTLWYLAALATELECDLSDVAETTIERLRSRDDRGVLWGDGDER